MHRQLGEQALEPALAADDAQRLADGDGRLEQAVGELLRQRVGNADAEGGGAPLRVVADRLLQFCAEGKDLVRIAEGEPAGIGQLQRAALAREQFDAEAVLQQTDLAADGLRRHVQRLAGPHDAAFLRGFPEVKQMLEVHGRPPLKLR
ncbi:hypothetical protein MASR1M97_13600 [Candidatus Desulfobacillus denitrificans]